ncbi:protein FAR1-RELATED SEQUENCE 5-like [Tripterygium wilfordii]|uniref:protein FAR1-RELATED SEQUENCE 5-like n=1 Tax=Tripterygium wilfordii TaxID=458696 RepID=UPI0018F7FD43|nr:protein FAR1-RELATED SEQUENCE 5-like [Tripterygium wilfordii]
MDSLIVTCDNSPSMRDGEQIGIPRIGMEFDTLDGGKKKDDDDMIRHRSSTKTDCKARLKVFLDKHRAIYIVNEFVEQHNHELQPPTIIHMFRSHRKLTMAHALAIEVASDSGLTPKVTQELMSMEAGGMAKPEFVIENQKSYLRSRRERNIGSEELGSIFSYFEKQNMSDPKFYYALQFDSDDKSLIYFRLMQK